MDISNDDMDIKDLLFTPTRFTIKDVQTLISTRVFTRQQVTSVLNEDTLRYVDSAPTDKLYIPISDTKNIVGGSNVVMVWGEKNAGKTSLIGSIVSMHGFLNGQEQLRYKKLTELFKTEGLQEMSSSDNDNPIETINIDYKPYLFGRSYSISFVEVNLGAEYVDWRYLEDSMKACMGHIHLFCLNCSPDDSHVLLQDSLERQVGYFNSVLAELEKRGLMDTACAIYVVVTKTDLMKAPKLYLDNAAQTLVTSSLSSFWHRILEICYAKQIYNAQPLTSSVGDFVLKDLAYINRKHTERLFYGSILPKCSPRKIFIERWLDYRKWWIKWIVLPMVMLFVLWGCYKTYYALSESPQCVVEPFDYEKYFREELGLNSAAL